ncbi:adenylate/guanylate cyclase domain-containing protein [Turneriella parva]|uniref:Adenylate/guanylate cyclase with integral membrane sensor n=1 Tax=Turneriella parva (strain ATCC BAA-1111 / DSM 21527 / NCTC 11395 / H) TaxID=869212 RepID=I4B3C3_TURPD|nr:adenylate/guanylate cyclase domain-containing protein [Turneriella parva]AFM11780.1 adenylate/guanylate cyclase with integral membrane sensor [Turneriella parva DSM 21527]
MSEQPGIPALARKKFKLSLLVAIPALVVTTGGLIVFFTLSNTRRTMEDFGWALFREATNQSVNETRNVIREAIPDIETLANLYRKGLLEADRSRQAGFYAELLRSHNDYSWVSFGDEYGTFIGANRPEPDGKLLRTNISWLAGGRTLSYEYDLDERGFQKFYKFDGNAGYDPRTRPFYELAKKSRHRVWTPPYIFFEQGVPGITCAKPVYGAGGRLKGVFSIDFDLNSLSEIVAKAKVSERGVVFIFTEEGEILGHPTMKVVTKTGQRGEGQILKVADVSDANIKAFFAELDATKGKDGKVHFKDRTQYNFDLDINGENFLATYSRFQIDEGLHWIIGIIAPEQDFRGIIEVKENYKRAYAISVAAILLSLMLAVVFTRLISTPLRSISLDMEKVGRLEIDSNKVNQSLFAEISAMEQHLQNMKGGLRSFASYVPKDLVRDLLKSGKEARLEGSTEVLTVLFTDIAGFTTFAEQLEPDELVQKLGKYFEIMTRAIMKHRGTIDKFIGDGIMAFWGAPAADSQHAVEACLAALSCIKALRELAASPEHGHWAKQLRTRFGIATGPVLVGNIGTTERMNYTVMGDTVNLSSRLEGINKLYNTSIIASELTYDLVKDQIIGRALDVVVVKGKKHGVRIYELLRRRDEATAEDLELERLSELGISSFMAKDMAAAKQAFAKILELHEQDFSAKLILQRIADYEALPDKSAWSPVNALTVK